MSSSTIKLKGHPGGTSAKRFPRSAGERTFLFTSISARINPFVSAQQQPSGELGVSFSCWSSSDQSPSSDHSSSGAEDGFQGTRGEGFQQGPGVDGTLRAPGTGRASFPISETRGQVPRHGVPTATGSQVNERAGTREPETTWWRVLPICH